MTLIPIISSSVRVKKIVVLNVRITPTVAALPRSSTFRVLRAVEAQRSTSRINRTPLLQDVPHPLHSDFGIGADIEQLVYAFVQSLGLESGELPSGPTQYDAAFGVIRCQFAWHAQDIG